MSDASSEISSCSSNASEYDESEGEMEMASQVEPYQYEPIASGSDEEAPNDEEADIDGLTPEVLERRYERQVVVSEWCRCGGKCTDENLVGALEFRCCHEVQHAIGMLVFDGSIERIRCITEHEDYPALTNRTVLLQVAPLLRTKDGKTYRTNGVSQNQLLRAVAYRWITRWLCGYMGWDNSRPLPACVYHNIRDKFRSHNSKGYMTTQDRE